MSKVTSLIRRAPKRFTAVALMIAAAIIIPTAALAWGPSRTVYDWNQPAADHVVFNSFYNNPEHGDERNFMQVREANASNTTYADSISLQADHEYVVYMYYHNNAKTSLNGPNNTGVGVAHGAYVKAQIPAYVAKGSTGTNAEGYVGATNATPKEVWDEVSFKNSSAGDILLNYVPGSATIHNKPTSGINGAKLSDSIVTSGAPIGYSALDGNVPGCNDFSGYVTFRVKATQSNYTISKEVRIAGQSEWKENVTANPGDTLEYLIEYVNTGSTTQKNVIVKDKLPTHVSYVPGSTTVKNTSSPNGKTINDDVVGIGVNIGDYTPVSNAFVKFSAKVANKDALPCGTTLLHNVAKVEVGYTSKEDGADVTVNKECEPGQITVCELSTKKLIVIKESDFDSQKYSKDLTVCDETTISVCELSTNEVIRINESAFDAKKHSKDLSVCVELPHTGMTENIVAIVGLGALIASLVYYIASRKALNQ